MRKSFLWVLIVLVLFVSCEERIAQNDSPEAETAVVSTGDDSWNEEIAAGSEVVDASKTDSYDVSESKGDSFFIKMNSSGRLLLKGMDSSLVSIEVKNADASERSRASTSAQVKLIESSGNSSIYVVVPSGDGSCSVSSSDLGINGDNAVVKVMMAEAENLSPTSTYGTFSYTVPEKEKTEEAQTGESYDQHWKYYTADLTSEEWKDYKDKVVCLSQALIRSSNKGGSSISQKIGILKDSKVYYDQSYYGLIDLTGMDKLEIYSYLKVYYMLNDATLNSYVILPEMITADGDPVEIKGYPHVFRLTGLEKSDYGYDIVMTGIASDKTEAVITELYAGMRTTKGRSVKRPYIVKYEKEGEGYTLTLHFDDYTPGDDLLLDFTWSSAQTADENTVFGSISVKKATTKMEKDYTLATVGTHDNVNVKAGKSLTIYYQKTDAEYTIELQDTGERGNCIFVHSCERENGEQSWGYCKFPYTIEAGESGSITILCRNEDCTLTYTVKKE